MNFIRPCIATLAGFVAGVLAVAIWMATFEPHGGVELSRYFFSLSAVVLERIYPGESVPALVWYGFALLQWVTLGVVVDLLCVAFRPGGTSRL